MNKQLCVAGVLTLGAVGLTVSPVARAEDVTGQTAEKPWTVSLALQGFYNDNIFTRPSGLTPSAKVKSWGSEVSPSLKYQLKEEATTLSFGYTYAGLWFASRSGNKWDNYHYLTGSVNHMFSERFSMSVSDSFAITKEPEQPLNGVVARTAADNIANYASIGATEVLSERFSIVGTYKNNFYQYDDAAYKAPLNRMEHLPSLDLKYQVAEKTFGILGYQFGATVYDKLTLPTVVATRLSSGTNTVYASSDVRDALSHYVYVGLDHKFTPELSGSVRVGLQYVEYDNYNLYLLGSNPSSTSPYADASLKYRISDGSVLLGVRHQRNPTDVTSAGGASSGLTLDQESTLVYVNLKHKIVGRLSGGLNGSYQTSSFKGGAANGSSEDFYSVGGSLEYMFNAYLSATAYYSHDKVTDQSGGALAGRDYSRNRVFFGLKATY